MAIEALSEPVPPPVSAPSDETVDSAPNPVPSVAQASYAKPEAANPLAETASTPSDTLFAVVREVIQLLLKVPMKDAEVSAALDVSNMQAKAWLQRLIDEGKIEKQKKPAGYVIKQSSLFE